MTRAMSCSDLLSQKFGFMFWFPLESSHCSLYMISPHVFMKVITRFGNLNAPFKSAAK
jgi:hypothetical protein